MLAKIKIAQSIIYSKMAFINDILVNDINDLNWIVKINNSINWQ